MDAPYYNGDVDDREFNAPPEPERVDDNELIGELVEALKNVVPAMPPADAMCHNGICSQARCSWCSRILAAHAATAKAEQR